MPQKEKSHGEVICTSGILFQLCPLMHRPWRRAGCGKWRVIIDLRYPPRSILSAAPSMRPTMGETDPITVVSFSARRRCAQAWIHMDTIHVRNFDSRAHDCEAERGGESGLQMHFKAFRVFFPLRFCGGEKYRSGSRRRLPWEYKFTFCCIRLMRTGRKGS